MKNHISGFWPGFSDKNKIYNNEIIRLGPCFDVYCTPPLESNRKRFLCATLTMMHNVDLSNYLIIFHGLDPANYISKDELVGYELWIEKSPLEATMHYFDFNNSEKGRMQRLELFKNKFVITKNDKAADWDEAMILQFNVDYVGSLSVNKIKHFAGLSGVSVDDYVLRVKNNYRYLVKEYNESLS